MNLKFKLELYTAILLAYIAWAVMMPLKLFRIDHTSKAKGLIVKAKGLLEIVKENEEEEPILERLEREEFDRKHVTPFVKHYPSKPGRQAKRQDIGKFMKHGKQSSYYRKTVKAHKKLDENEI